MKKKLSRLDIRMMNLSLDELKLIAKSRGIEGYKSMSEERLLNAFDEEKNFYDARLKKIRKEFNKLRFNFF